MCVFYKVWKQSGLLFRYDLKLWYEKKYSVIEVTGTEKTLNGQTSSIKHHITSNEFRLLLNFFQCMIFIVEGKKDFLI